MKNKKGTIFHPIRVINGCENNKITYLAGVDLTTEGSRLVDISNAIVARYDAGICTHKLERTGVVKIEYENKENTNICN